MVGDGGELGRVGEHAGEERAADRGQRLARVLGVERVAVVVEQREMQVHARARQPVARLGHERRVAAELARDLFDADAKGRHGVGHRERVGVMEVDLVLRRRELGVGGLHRDAAHLPDVLDRPPGAL